MKKNLKTYLFLGLLLLFSPIALTQEFSVDIDETDPYNGLIKPLKPGASHSLTVKVKNNSISPKCNVIPDRS
jgi:hypothetical protein